MGQIYRSDLNITPIRGFTMSGIPFVNQGVDLDKLIERVKKYASGVYVKQTRVCHGLEVILPSYVSEYLAVDMILAAFEDELAALQIPQKEDESVN